MSGVDLALKPTLATFPFRVQKNELPATGPIHEAEDGDDALLAMIDSQAEIASLKFKGGWIKQAVAVLHRAYRIIENYTESFPSTDPVPPAAMLAAATVRLGLCVVLSKCGRHTQALDEAKMAAVETDKVWRLLFLASAEQEAATADGDRSRPSQPLRDALRNPPKWLERAVETAVQARHCIAIELEYEDKPNRLGNKSSALDSDSVFSTESGQTGDIVPDPVPRSEALSVQEQIGKLHREGVQLSRELLRVSHPVRIRAELALDEWLQRTGGDGQPNLAPSASPLCRAMSQKKLASIRKNALLSSPPVQPASRRLSLVPSQTLSWSQTAPPLGLSASLPTLGEADLPKILHMGVRKRLPPPGTTWSNLSVQTMTTASVDSAYSSAVLPQSMSMGTSQMSFASVPGGDVSRELPQLGKSTAKLRPSKAPEEQEDDKAGFIKSKTLQQKQAEAAILLAEKDPFENWRRNMVNERQMSHFQRQLKTNEGLTSLQSDMKGEARIFKVGMKDISDADLFELRSKFGPAALVTNQQAEKKKEQFKSENWTLTEEGEQRNRTKTELFQYYGTNFTGDKPSLASLGKLLQKSSTHGSNLTKIAKEEEKRQLALKREENALFYQNEGMVGIYKKSAKNAGRSPVGRFHKTMSSMTVM